MMNSAEQERLYTEYFGKVFGYIKNRVGDTQLAEDITSEVFVKIYEKIGTFDAGKASLSTWVFTVMRNTLTDYFRTRKVNDEIPETLTDETDIEYDIIGKETLDALSDALRALEEKKRDIIIFHYYNGLSLREISEKMNLSYSYIKVLHKKALDELKLTLGKIYNIF